jgi:guanylate kinase
VFIKPPTFELLRERLVKRNTESEESLKIRLENSKKEMEFSESEEGKKLIDYYLVNDKLDIAYSELKNILKNKLIL